MDYISDSADLLPLATRETRKLPSPPYCLADCHNTAANPAKLTFVSILSLLIKTCHNKTSLRASSDQSSSALSEDEYLYLSIARNGSPVTYIHTDYLTRLPAVKDLHGKIRDTG